jgi:hypothetical protein
MKKFKCPKTIEIGGVTFKIKVYKRCPKDVRDELGEVSGWCDSANKEIGIILKYADDLTLFHEIGHAAASIVRTNSPLDNETFARPFFAIFFGALKSSGLVRP